MSNITSTEMAAKIEHYANPVTAGPVTKANMKDLLDYLQDYVEEGDDALVGVVAGTGVTCAIKHHQSIATLTFTLTAVAITMTDAAASGMSGSIQLFDFVQAGLQPLASRSNMAWTGDALIDADAGDLAFVYGFGSVAANAGDGALTSTEVDFAAVSGTVTLSSKLASSTEFKGAGTIIDGTATAADLYLNLSATAATAEANGVMTVTGTITVVCAMVGDD